MRHISTGNIFKTKGVLGAIVGTLGCIIFFRQYLLAPGWNWLVSDDFDSRLLTWIFEWGYHILFEELRPLDFFQANSFFPNPNSLAFSDSLLSGQIFYAPFRMLGIPTIPAIYAALSALTIFATILSDRGLCRLSFSASERILIIWVSHFGLSISSFLGHYQLFGFQLATPFFIYLYLFLKETNLKDAIILGVISTIAILFSMYLAPMFVIVSFFAALPFVLRLKNSYFSSPKQLKQIGLGTIILICFALFIYLIQLHIYFEIAKTLSKQSFEETAQYSARILSLVRGFSIVSYWYGPSGYGINGDWERAYFPGFLLLLSVVTYSVLTLAQWVGGVTIFKKSFTNDSSSKKLNVISFDTFCFLIFISSLILSWGPFIGTDASKPLPFYYLSDLFPGLSSVRAPGRFGMFFGLPLSIIMIFLIRNWERSPFRASFISYFFFIAIIIETLPNIPIHKIPYGDDTQYKVLQSCINKNEPLIELPVAGPGHIETLKLVMAQLNGSTHHWAKMVVGYGSRYTPELMELISIDQEIQNNGSSPEKLLQFSKRLGINKILIRTDRHSSERYKTLLSQLSAYGSVSFCPLNQDTFSIVKLN